MKHLRDLTADDLRTTPVWKSLGGPDADALVEPTKRATLSETEGEIFVALTDFVLGNGQQHIGFCSPVGDSGLDYVQPVILTAQGHVNLWFDQPPGHHILAEQWSRLGVSEADLFPIKYECLVPVDGRRVVGELLNLRSMGGVA